MKSIKYVMLLVLLLLLVGINANALDSEQFKQEIQRLQKQNFELNGAIVNAGQQIENWKHIQFTNRGRIEAYQMFIKYPKNPVVAPVVEPEEPEDEVVISE